jgi:S-DNA-T family DNA segregation ATPase FtsK/SpoIIIE
MVAATQRPTQKVMGQGAVRSQMDIRTCFRVRERRDVDLILGQGMLSAGWHAHTLNAPGKFLISAPGHDIPRRGRAYLLSDEAVRATAERYATTRPALDEVSQRVLTERLPEALGLEATGRDAGEDDPDAILWAALSFAPEDGIPVTDLVTATGMSHRWVNYRLRALADSGQAIQLKRGMWRAITPEGDNS